MRFVSTVSLILLLGVPAFIVFYIFVFRIRRKNLLSFGDLNLMKTLAASTDTRKQKIKVILLISGFLFLVFAVAGPQIGTRMVKVKRRGVDVIIAIDTSKSMLAEDIKPNRLTKAKIELKSFIERLKGDRIGIIAFSGTAFLQCPLTLDYAAAQMFMDIIDTNLIPLPGTSVGEAIRLATKSFTRQQRKYKVLILLTDGEDHRSNPMKAADEAKKEGVRIYTIGIGTLEGEPIPVKDETGKTTGYKKNKKGEIVMSKLEELTLEKIALKTGGKYYRATGGEMELDRIYDDISSMEKKELKSRLYTQYENRYQYFLFFAMIFLIIEFLLSDRKKIIASMILIFLLPFSVEASLSGDIKKGNKLYEKKKYEEALKSYRDAQIDSPKSPIAHFNIGNALYKKKEYEKALKEYLDATYSKDIKVQSQAYYNMGNCKYRLGQLEEAIQYYKKAIEMNLGDEDAKYNIEFVQKKIKEMMDKHKQQAGKSGKKEEEKKKNDKSSKGKKEEEKDKKKSEEKKEAKKEDEEKKGKEAKKKDEKKPGEMSKEEAEALLEQMKDDEKKAREKLRRKVPSRYNVEEDW